MQKPTLLLLSLLLTMCLSQSSEAKSHGGIEAIPGEFVVKLKGDVFSKSGEPFQELVNRLQNKLSVANSAKGGVTFKKFITDGKFATIRSLSTNKTDLLNLLKQDPSVAYAEPNYIYRAIGKQDSEVIPNDAKMGELWGMKNTGQADAAGQVGVAGADIDVAPVWGQGITGNRNIKVAVIDTGIDANHPDLAANVDASLGYNFATNSPDATDDNNHGTHCSGTIGGLGNNEAGVVGVNWNVTLIPIKFLDHNGSGSLANAVQSIQWATKQNVHIMSNSWGGGGYSQAMYDAINEAKEHGILFVAAAGNDGTSNETGTHYPSNYDLPNVISVAATDNRDQLARFSNYGRTKVHVAAPGVKIMSTLKQGGYGAYSGTSMATPHVSGIAALMLSANPSLTYAQIKDILIRSSDPVASLARKVAAGGRVNASNAINGVFPERPGVPSENEWVDVANTSIESAHPYANNANQSFAIAVPNAKYVRVIFERFDLEQGYDVVELRSASGELIDSVTGAGTNYATDYASGGSASLVLKSDSDTTAFGFKVAKVQAIF